MKKRPETELTPELLLHAYASGVFPMDELGELRWYSPDPRGIIPLEGFRTTRSLRQTIRKQRFEVRINTAFEQVMIECGRRPEGTWISDRLLRCYVAMHRMGAAHSVECWRSGRLVGGLYGVAIGGAFFGESMFHRETDASKVALVALVDRLREGGFTLLDTQWTTPHLEQFGAIEIPRAVYLKLLADALHRPANFAAQPN